MKGNPMEIQTIQPFLKYFANIRERTMRVARLVPPDKIDWSYAPGKFTFGDLLRHLAGTERYMWAETVHLRPCRYTSHGRELAATYEEVIALMERLHVESMELFGQLSDQDLRRKCKTPAGSDIETAKWLRALTEHEIHHRGQLYLYLSMLGVKTPPIFGLTSEEVRSRSLNAQPS
jgi:uncharacterized damage-inducible protein DinB